MAQAMHFVLRKLFASHDELMTVQLFCQSNETADLLLYLKPPE